MLLLHFLPTKHFLLLQRPLQTRACRNSFFVDLLAQLSILLFTKRAGSFSPLWDFLFKNSASCWLSIIYFLNNCRKAFFISTSCFWMYRPSILFLSIYCLILAFGSGSSVAIFVSNSLSLIYIHYVFLVFPFAASSFSRALILAFSSFLGAVTPAEFLLYPASIAAAVCIRCFVKERQNLFLLSLLMFFLLSYTHRLCK